MTVNDYMVESDWHELIKQHYKNNKTGNANQWLFCSRSLMFCSHAFSELVIQQSCHV